MSFAENIKLEIIDKELNKNKIREMVNGIISSSSIFENGYHWIKINNDILSSKIQNLLKIINVDFSVGSPNKNIKIKNWKQNKEILYPSQFFGGCFIGGGSISKLESTSYHLEIQFYDKKQMIRVKDFLNNYIFNFLYIERRNMQVIYIKKSAEITDFLRAIEAFNALMSFEGIRIERDYRNQLNRLTNNDIMNQKKLAIATIEFEKRYNYVYDNNLIDRFNKKEIDFFEIKKNNKFSTYEELVRMYQKKTGIVRTKSALNHWMIKLKKVVDEDKGK